MKHNHPQPPCWHIIVKSPNGVITSEICCWCGERRIQSAESQTSGIHGSHVPHAPGSIVVGPSEFKEEMVT